MNFLEEKEDEKKNYMQDMISKMSGVPTAVVAAVVTGDPMSLLAAMGTMCTNIVIGNFLAIGNLRGNLSDSNNFLKKTIRVSRVGCLPSENC